MKSIDDIHFDVCKFTYADGIREIIIHSVGEEFKITGTEVTQLAGLDFWIVPSGPIESLFGEHYKSVYSRFFGVLLKALHKHNSSMPIHGICLGDIARAYEDGKGRESELADEIASGAYVPSR